MSQKLSITIMALGILVIITGGLFVYQGISKGTLVRDNMRDERVTYLLSREDVQRGKVIETAEEAQKVADIIKTHRRAIAPNYEELLKGGQFDAANPQHITYSQALNLENYLYMAVLAFGLATEVLTCGITFIITGICFVLIGTGLYRTKGMATT